MISVRDNVVSEREHRKRLREQAKRFARVIDVIAHLAQDLYERVDSRHAAEASRLRETAVLKAESLIRQDHLEGQENGKR